MFQRFSDEFHIAFDNSGPIFKIADLFQRTVESFDKSHPLVCLLRKLRHIQVELFHFFLDFLLIQIRLRDPRMRKRSSLLHPQTRTSPRANDLPEIEVFYQRVSQFIGSRNRLFSLVFYAK